MVLVKQGAIRLPAIAEAIGQDLIKNMVFPK
jgi:hypothetical protein